MVILVTGKAGAGKTVYGERMVAELLLEGKKAILLDGDVWRKEHDNQDYTNGGRRKNLRSAAEHAASYEKDGYVVVMSFIAPRKVWRNMMRRYWKRSRVVYIPGGTLWDGTTYEKPSDDEYRAR